MYNTIKKINFEVIYERLTDFKKDESEERLSDYCFNIEDSKEFQKLFFFKETDCHNYFYELKDEQKIKDFLKSYFDKEVLTDDLFKEYGEELRDIYSGDYIEIKSYIGKLVILEENFYASLQEEFLRNEEIIKRLVKAEDFYEEMETVKRDCLKYLIEMLQGDIEIEVKKYKFD